METLGKEKSSKRSKSSDGKYHCLLCDYTTSKKHNLTKHFTTAKHIRRTQGKVKVASSKNGGKGNVCFCRYCKKSFQGYSGRWKHEKKCPGNPTVLQQKLEEAKKEIESFKKEKEEQNKKIHMLELKNEKDKVKHLTKLQEKTESELAARDRHIEDLKKHAGGTQNINTQNNNYINIQLYLNEKCKNAMPIMDFIRDLQFKLTDINPERPASTIESLSKCITDKLEDMDQTERPVHCSDAKRLVFHVKDASGWTKDINNKKMDKAIGWANMRHQGAWVKKATSEDLVNQKNDLDYLNMNVAMGKFSDDPEKAKRKVKRAIAKAVHLKLPSGPTKA